MPARVHKLQRLDFLQPMEAHAVVTLKDKLEDSAEIYCGSRLGGVSLRVERGVLRIRVVNEPRGDDLVDVIRRAFEGGLLAVSTPTLVDLTEYYGTLDWEAIHKIRAMAPWGTGKPGAARVAYVSRDRLFAALIKLLRGLFPDTRHRLFATEPEALAWLQPAAAGRRGGTAPSANPPRGPRRPGAGN